MCREAARANQQARKQNKQTNKQARRKDESVADERVAQCVAFFETLLSPPTLTFVAILILFA
jgi:hypothetical protein